MKIKILLTVMSLLAITSCYEDKGNYDYREMNDIEISVETESSFYALGDKVISKPELVFTLGKENSDLSYEWTFDGHVIGDTKDLEWIADTIASTKELRLAVFDNNTGVTYFGSTYISVSSSYASNGWVVLSEKEGNSTLSFLREQTEEGILKPVVTRDIYSMINGVPMGTQPVSMYPHWTERWDGEDKTSWLWVAQKGGQGAIDISGSSYKQEGILSQMFLSKSYPEGFVSVGVIDMQFLTMAIGEDGTIYTRVKDSNLLFNSSNFLDRPLTSDKEGKIKVDGSMIAYAPFDEHGGMVLYDKNSAQYLHIADYKNWQGYNYSGKVLPLKVEEYEYGPSDARLDNMKDYSVYFVGASLVDWGDISYMSIIKDKAGKFYMQKFKVEAYGGGSSVTKVGASFISQSEIKGLDAVIDGTSKNCFYLCRNQDKAPYLFISKGETLYFYYTDGNKLYTCAQFDSPIASIDAECFNNKYIIVGLESGDVFILKGEDDNSDYTLKKYVIQQNKVIQVTDAENKFVLFHEKDFGKIIQVRYKWKESWNESFS